MPGQFDLNGVMRRFAWRAAKVGAHYQVTLGGGDLGVFAGAFASTLIFAIRDHAVLP